MNKNSEALLVISETMQALQNQILAALEDNTNVLKALDFQPESCFLEDRANLLSHPPIPAVTLKDDRGKTFTVDTDMVDILLLMFKQIKKN